MVELATAALAAAMLNNSVSAVDKIYDWWKRSRGERPASMGLRSDPEKEELKFVPLNNADKPVRVVMTYEQLAEILTEDDIQHIKGFERRMQLAMAQWDQLNARLPLAGDVERVRIEANMVDMKNSDICFSLKQIVDFINERLHIDLEDHYRHVRHICPA